MSLLQRLFAFYIDASIHVALAVLALVLVTAHQFGLPYDADAAGFAFFGSVVGYNFVKYESLFRLRKPMRKLVKAIAVFSALAAVGAAFFFFRLNADTKWTAIATGALLFLYAVPLFSDRANFRNVAGIKIYIVCLCWSIVTVVVPVINAGIPFSADVWLKCIQRFMLVLTLILVFEIIDLTRDDPSLGTVPQRIGVAKTKALGLLLMAGFFVLEFCQSTFDPDQLTANGILFAATALFTWFAHPQRGRHYTAFWVESLPIFWYLLLLALSPQT
jgi:hypothetical protein